MNNRVFLVSDAARPEDVILVEVNGEIEVDAKLLIAGFLPLRNREVFNHHQNILVISDFQKNTMHYSLGINSEEMRTFKFNAPLPENTEGFIFSEELGKTCPTHLQITPDHVIPFISEETVTPEQIDAMVGEPPNTPTHLNEANVRDEDNFKKLLARYGLSEKDYRTYFLNGIKQTPISDDTLKQIALHITDDHPLLINIKRLQDAVNYLPEALAEHKTGLNHTLVDAREIVNTALSGEAVIEAAQTNLIRAFATAKEKLLTLKQAIYHPHDDGELNALGNGIAVINYHYAMLTHYLRRIVIESAAHLIKIKKSALKEESWVFTLQTIIQNFNTKFGDFAILTPDLCLVFKTLPGQTNKLDILSKIADGFSKKTGETLSERRDTHGCYITTIKYLSMVTKSGPYDPAFMIESPYLGADTFKILESTSRQEISTERHKTTVGQCDIVFREALANLENPEKQLRLAIEASVSRIASAVETSLADVEEKVSQGHCDELLKRLSIESRHAAFKAALEDALNLETDAHIEGIENPEDEKIKYRLSTTITLIDQSRQMLALRAHFIRTNSRGIDIHSEAGENELTENQKQLDTALQEFRDARQQHIAKLHKDIAALATPEPLPSIEPIDDAVDSAPPVILETHTPDALTTSTRPRAQSAGSETPNFMTSSDFITAQLSKTVKRDNKAKVIAQVVAEETFSPLTRLLQSLKKITGLSWQKTAICITAGVLIGAGAGIAAFFLFPTLVIPAVVAIGLAATALVITASITGVTLYHKHKEREAAYKAMTEGGGIVQQPRVRRSNSEGSLHKNTPRPALDTLRGLSYFAETPGQPVPPASKPRPLSIRSSK